MFHISHKREKMSITVRICLSESLHGRQANKTCTRAHTPLMLSSTGKTHAVKSIENHQLSSKLDLAAQSHRCGGEEVICGRSVRDFRAREPGSEKRRPSFNSAINAEQKPHQFSLITPRCCMGSTYRKCIYQADLSIFYMQRRSNIRRFCLMCTSDGIKGSSVSMRCGGLLLTLCLCRLTGLAVRTVGPSLCLF